MVQEGFNKCSLDGWNCKSLDLFFTPGFAIVHMDMKPHRDCLIKIAIVYWRLMMRPVLPTVFSYINSISCTTPGYE